MGQLWMLDLVALSIVIPTFGREEVLVDTVSSLLSLNPSARELILVDQTLLHDATTVQSIAAREREGRLRWLQLERPSIPHAMNVGLRSATGEIVLFLDDDVEPDSRLIAAHLAAHEEFPDAWAVVGQVLQPGEASASRGRRPRGTGFRSDLEFPFWSNERAWVANVMAGNLSVKCQRALAVGGFDENFRGVAYRFETEFARRLIAAGGRVLFEPAASLKHLRAVRGGTRSAGSHLTSSSSKYGMGDYYFALRSGLTWETAGYMLRRPLREVCTKFHLTHPWYIPVKFLGELRAFGAAVRAIRSGPKFTPGERPSPSAATGLGVPEKSSEVGIAR
jgi:GT2 family glycosyltransferase